MQAAARTDRLRAGTQPQVIRVAQNNPRIKLFRFKGFKARALDCAERADGHEDGRLDHPAPCCEQTRASLTISRQHFKCEGLFVHLREIKDWSSVRFE